MTHRLVNQLHFARKEFLRCLEDVNAEDAQKRLLPMNCISWIIGHLTSQEDTYWNYLGQGNARCPDLRNLVGFGKPASTPPLDEMWAAWKAVTEKADRYLISLKHEDLYEHFLHKAEPLEENIGTMLRRNIYHYWFHTGEAHAIRQMLGHGELPQFVGDMSGFEFKKA